MKACSVLEAVEQCCIAQKSAVALFTHIGDYAADGWQHGVERRAAAPFERNKDFLGLSSASSFGPDGFHL
jgi:hypothetical protein